MQGRQRAFLCEMGTGTRSVTERFWLLALVVGTLGVLVGVLVLVGGTVLGAVVRAVLGAGWTVLGLLVLLGVWALFLLFTFRAPELPLFIDPLTGLRGI